MRWNNALGSAVLYMAAALAMPTAAHGDVFTSYQAVKKTIYVWNPGASWWAWMENGSAERLVAFCQMHGAHRAIVFIGSVQWEWPTSFQQGQLPHEPEYVYLGAKLRQAGIEPVASFYLNDAPGDLTGYAKAADIVTALAGFNARHPDSALVGLDGDQEPGSVTPEYMAMNSGMEARKAQLGATFPIGAALRPKWLSDPSTQGRGSGFADAFATLDDGLLMAYRSTQSASVTWGMQGLDIAAMLSKPLHVAIETADLGSGNADSFYPMVAAADKTPFFQMVVDIDRSYAGKPFYAGFAIHAYKEYFTTLYGVSPEQYPSTTFDSLYTGGPKLAPVTFPPVGTAPPSSGGSGSSMNMSATAAGCSIASPAQTRQPQSSALWLGFAIYALYSFIFSISRARALGARCA